jgi:polar amino acid transport system substrate-binding protein
LIAAPSTHAAYELFAAQKLDALVGLRPRLVADAAMMPGSRVLDGRFMVVGQSIALPHGRTGAAEYLGSFVEDVTASGLVGQWLTRHGVHGVTVAGSG